MALCEDIVSIWQNGKPKPCPFCGADAEYSYHNEGSFEDPYIYERHRIRCGNTYCSVRPYVITPFMNAGGDENQIIKELTEKWNMRVSDKH